MDINTLVSQVKQGTLIVEDVYVDHSWDGTSAEVHICGPYGKELCQTTLADAELDALKSELGVTEFLPLEH